MTTMTDAEIWMAIFGMFITNFMARFIPIAILGNRKLPYFFERWLHYVPCTVFGALIFTSVLGDYSHGFNFSTSNISLLTTVVVVAVAAKTRSLAATIVAGIAVFWGLQQVM